MSGVHGQLLGHLAKRGAAILATGVAVDSDRDAYIKSLETKARMYEDSPMKDVQPWEAAIVVLTFVLFMVIYASVKYTLGEVVASLAMIEQPKTVIISEYRAVANEDADAPSDKDKLLDEEVTVYREKPITSSIRQTIRHIASVGGYTARWRGLQVSIVYHMLQAILAHLLAAVFAFLPFVGTFAFIFGSILSTVLLARIHMTWTHIMISTPSALPWYRRVPRGRTYFKALITPAMIFAIAQHLTVILPLMVYFSFGPVATSPKSVDVQNEVLRLVAMVCSMAFVGIALLLPASVTLTRVEATLLPDDTETIVNFDRTLGGAAVNLVGFGKINFRALSDAAWRSFDKASRIRLLKFYVKYAAIITVLVISFSGIIAAEVILLGSDRLFVLTQSATAQIQLASIQAAGQ